MTWEQNRLRLPAAFATSAAIHATVLAFLLRAALSNGGPFVGPPEPPPEARLIRVSLVSRPGGGGGGPLPGLPSAARGPAGALPQVAKAAPQPLPQVQLDKPPPAIPNAPPRVAAAPVITAPRLPSPVRFPAPAIAAKRPAQEAPARDAPPLAAPPANAAPAGAAGNATASLGGNGQAAGRGGGGAGTGDGTGGDGSDGTARPAHGTNPKPPYPLAAKRLGVEGVVMLEVVVRPDGSPADVRVRDSSGSALLDDSALETVRSKWRFIPARRGNAPVESRVTVPIRFRLDAS